MHHWHPGHCRGLQCAQALPHVPSVTPQAWPHEHEYSNPAVLAAELRAFAQAAGIPSNMLPTARALTQANRHDLLQVRSHATGLPRLPEPVLHVASLPSRQLTTWWAD